LFDAKARLSCLLVGSFCSLAAAYSLAAGVAASTTLGSLFVIAELARRDATADERNRSAWLRVATVVGIHVVGLTLYFRGHALASPSTMRSWPNEEFFWLYYLELVAAGFGRAAVDFDWALAIGIFATAPVVTWMLGSRLRMRHAEWALVAAWLACAAGLASISHGRAGMGSLELAKIPRYVELAGMMLPLTLGVWQLHVRELSPGVRAAFWSAALIFLLAASDRSWSIEPSYRQLNGRLVDGAACVQHYYADPTDDGWCPQVYPGMLPPYLNLARQLQLSFTRGSVDRRSSHLPTQDR
jgi:hypothetical protein